MDFEVPTRYYQQVVKWILRYLRDTIGVCLEFGRSKDGLVGYIDADYAGNRDKRRSMTSYEFFVVRCAVSWKATLQHMVALSTTEAEYIAATEGIKEAMWLIERFICRT